MLESLAEEWFLRGLAPDFRHVALYIDEGHPNHPQPRDPLGKPRFRCIDDHGRLLDFGEAPVPLMRQLGMENGV